MERYDYIVVGAGSAGCVLANRLGADGRMRILVIEAGGSDRATIVRMPSALSIPMNTKRFNWGFVTESEPHLNGRVMNLPRGKGPDLIVIDQLLEIFDVLDHLWITHVRQGQVFRCLTGSYRVKTKVQTAPRT